MGEGTGKLREQDDARIDTDVVASDSDFIKTKKEYFQREISTINTIELMPKLKVPPCSSLNCI